VVVVYRRGARIAAGLRYHRRMKLALAFATVALAAACGGSSKSAPPTLGTSSSGKKLPFDPEQVRAAVAAGPGTDACSAEVGQTFEALFEYQRGLLASGDPASVEVSFSCLAAAAGDGTYECTWSVFSKPSGAPDPDDPCGGECCSGFQIMIPVAADGSFDATAITCVAPG
jgi:hypothetical protein